MTLCAPFTTPLRQLSVGWRDIADFLTSHLRYPRQPRLTFCARPAPRFMYDQVMEDFYRRWPATRPSGHMPISLRDVSRGDPAARNYDVLLEGFVARGSSRKVAYFDVESERVARFVEQRFWDDEVPMLLPLDKLIEFCPRAFTTFFRLRARPFGDAGAVPYDWVPRHLQPLTPLLPMGAVSHQKRDVHLPQGCSWSQDKAATVSVFGPLWCYLAVWKLITVDDFFQTPYALISWEVPGVSEGVYERRHEFGPRWMLRPEVWKRVLPGLNDYLMHEIQHNEREYRVEVGELLLRGDGPAALQCAARGWLHRCRQ